MNTKLVQLEKRIEELESLAGEVARLAESLKDGYEYVQPELSTKGQRWYRGAREILVQHGFSGLEEFDECYSTRPLGYGIARYINIAVSGRDKYEWQDEARRLFEGFVHHFQKARALVVSALEELRSRELPVRSQLSFNLSAGEFDTAQELLDAGRLEEPVLRAAGVVARVALERHLFTVAESRAIPIQVNPPTKKKAEAEDVVTTLYKAEVITGIQQSELQSLFKVANNCAHPKEVVKAEDVERLIRRAKELAAVIL